MKIPAGLAATLLLAACLPPASPSGTPMVADLVRSLPNRYFESPAYPSLVLRDGTPRPAAQQNKYLGMPEYALTPERQFLKLDDHHLLIHSKPLQIAEGTPAQLEILRKNTDSSWTDLTPQAIPVWARHPRDVHFSHDFTRITVTGNTDEHQTFTWASPTLSPCP